MTEIFGRASEKAGCIVPLVAAALVPILLVGCSSTRLQEVTVPAQQSTVTPPSVTDSMRLERVAPVPPPAKMTAPVRVEQYESARPGGAVSRISVSDQEVTVVRPDGEVITYEAPVFGETLDIRPTGDTTKAQVRGEPEEETVEAKVPEEDEGFFGQVGSGLAWIGGFVLLGAVAFVLVKFTDLVPTLPFA